MRTQVLLALGAFTLGGCNAVLGIDPDNHNPLDGGVTVDGPTARDAAADRTTVKDSGHDVGSGSGSSSTADSGSSSTTGSSSGSADAGHDGGHDAGHDAGHDSGIDASVKDSGHDVGSGSGSSSTADSGSSSTTGSSSGSADAGHDGGHDAGHDAGHDSGIDASVCTAGTQQCSGNGVETCDGTGTWGAAVACSSGTGQTGGTTPFCYQGSCSADPPSCQGGGPGAGNDCGGSSGTPDCCTSLEVPGGTFSRDGNASYPATISGFRLDKYLVTVGRFRAFITAGASAWSPAVGAGLIPSSAT